MPFNLNNHLSRPLYSALGVELSVRVVRRGNWGSLRKHNSPWFPFLIYVCVISRSGSSRNAVLDILRHVLQHMFTIFNVSLKPQRGFAAYDRTYPPAT